MWDAAPAPSTACRSDDLELCSRAAATIVGRELLLASAGQAREKEDDVGETTIIALGILGATVIITVVALLVNRVDKILPIITLLFGLAGGGAIGSVAANQASESAADDAATQAVEQLQETQP